MNTPEQKRAIRDAMYVEGKPCTRFPRLRWHLAIHFTDTDGSHRATWQLLLPNDRGATYSLTLRDGIPCEELAPESISGSDRIGLRDEASFIERERIGAPVGA